MSNDERVMVEGAEEADELDILNEMNASEADVTYRARVSRVHGPTKLGSKEPFLFEGDASIVIPNIHTRLMEEYGNGLYRVRVLKNNRMWHRFDISIERPAGYIPPAPPRQPQQLNGQPSDLNGIALMLQNQMQFMKELMSEVRAERQPQIVATQNPLEMFKMFSEIAANLRGTAPDASALIEVFKSGLDIATKISGEGHEKGTIDLISDLIQSPLLANAVAGMGSKQLPAPANSPAPALGQVKPETDQGPEEISPEYLIDQLNYLVDKASRGKNHELMAELMLDELPYEVLKTFLFQDGIVSQLATLNQGVAVHKTWFDRLLVSMRQQARNDPGLKELFIGHNQNLSDGNTGRPGRDAGNAENHGPNRP